MKIPVLIKKKRVLKYTDGKLPFIDEILLGPIISIAHTDRTRYAFDLLFFVILENYLEFGMQKDFSLPSPHQPEIGLDL